MKKTTFIVLMLLVIALTIVFAMALHPDRKEQEDPSLASFFQQKNEEDGVTVINKDSPSNQITETKSASEYKVSEAVGLPQPDMLNKMLFYVNDFFALLETKDYSKAFLHLDKEFAAYKGINDADSLKKYAETNNLCNVSCNIVKVEKIGGNRYLLSCVLIKPEETADMPSEVFEKYLIERKRTIDERIIVCIKSGDYMLSLEGFIGHGISKEMILQTGSIEIRTGNFIAFNDRIQVEIITENKGSTEYTLNSVIASVGADNGTVTYSPLEGLSEEVIQPGMSLKTEVSVKYYGDIPDKLILSLFRQGNYSYKINWDNEI